MTRNDAARRAVNEAYKPGDVWCEKERWLPVPVPVEVWNAMGLA